MAKGNFTALQQLKPAELKVVDYYDKFVDGFIKNGEADRAAFAKKLADDKKDIGERLAQLKIDPTRTIPKLRDMSDNMFLETADYIGQQGILAKKDPSNSYKYLQNIERVRDTYRTYAIAVSDPDFIKASEAKAEAMQNGDLFTTTDNNAKLAFLSQAMPIYKLNKDTGDIEFYMPKNEFASDEDPLEKQSMGQILSSITSKDEINVLQSNKSNNNNGFLDKQVYDIAKVMSDEYKSNTDGNRTDYKKWFSEERGDLWFDSHFGTYNPNRINPIVSQYSRQVLQKEIGSDPTTAEADFKAAKTGIINLIASVTPTETKTETKDTPVDTALRLQQLENARLEGIAKRQSIANGGRSSGGSSGGSGGFTSVSEGMVNKRAEVIVQIPDAKTGEVKGIQIWAANTIPLPKVKAFPATDNTFGLSKFRNKKGDEVRTLIMSAQADNGKRVYAKINPEEFSTYVSQAGYDPYDVMNKLEKGNNSYNKYTGQVTQKPIYTKVKVGYKAKEVKSDDEDLSF